MLRNQEFVTRLVVVVLLAGLARPGWTRVYSKSGTATRIDARSSYSVADISTTQQPSTPLPVAPLPSMAVSMLSNAQGITVKRGAVGGSTCLDDLERSFRAGGYRVMTATELIEKAHNVPEGVQDSFDRMADALAYLLQGRVLIKAGTPDAPEVLLAVDTSGKAPEQLKPLLMGAILGSPVGTVGKLKVYARDGTTGCSELVVDPTFRLTNVAGAFSCPLMQGFATGASRGLAPAAPGTAPAAPTAAPRQPAQPAADRNLLPQVTPEDLDRVIPGASEALKQIRDLQH